MSYPVAKTPFIKVANTPAQLLAKLQAQGLTVPAGSHAAALNYLQYVGGYRLKGYWHHMLQPGGKMFVPGTTFDDITARCEFDRELRAATIEAIDRLEVSIRTSMANYLSLKHSPHWFLEPKIFKPTAKWGLGQLIRKIEDEVRRSEQKRFVKHYMACHDDPYLPPSWSITECVSFGLWSRTYAILRDVNDKKAISMKFGIDQPDVFTSWIHTLTVIRNVAAHHGQLLHVKQGVGPANYTKIGIAFADNKAFYAAATVISVLLKPTNLPNRWKNDLVDIFSRNPNVPIAEIGFPATWQTEPGW